jgi:hypothetical protein
MQAAEKDLFVAADDCVTQRCSRNRFLWIAVSAENFSDIFLSPKFVQSSIRKQQIWIYLTNMVNNLGFLGMTKP